MKKNAAIFVMGCALFFNVSADERTPNKVFKLNPGQGVCMVVESARGFWPVFTLPLTFQWGFCNWVSLDASLDVITLFPLPVAADLTGGVSVFPLGKAPLGLYLNAMAGMQITANGVFKYARATAGYQWKHAGNFLFDVGGGVEYARWIIGQDFCPYVTLAFGWAF
ncbi:MAG: hypothetical protein WCT14_09055 [Treponemataceae bacterium]